MAFYSTQRVTSDGTLVLLPVSIEYFDRSEITVFFDDVLAVEGTDWNWVGSTDHTISFPSEVLEGVEVLVVRTTDIATVRHIFTDGAAFLDETMDENYRQILHIAQEARERQVLEDIYNDLNMHGYKIRNVGLATEPNDAISLAQYQADAAGAWTARNQAIAAKDAAIAAKNQAETAEANAESAAAAAASSVGSIASYAEAASNSADASAASALAAEGFKTTASNERLGAEEAANSAEDSATLAQRWANELPGPVDGSEYSAKKYAQDAEAAAAEALTSASPTGGGMDKVFYLNGQHVTANFNIPANKNCSVTGPLVIDTGVSVVINAGARMVII